MSQHLDWYRVLSEAAQFRGINLPVSNAEDLNEDEATKIESWVNQNFRCQTPLTAEELTIWQHIANNHSQRDENQPNDGPEPGLLEEDTLKRLTQRLQHSTAKLRLGNNDVTHPDGTFEAGIESQDKAENQHLYFMNDELESSLRRSLQGVQEKCEKCARAINSTVAEKLKADDRDLASLSELTGSLAVANPIREARTSQLLAALRQARASTIKARLDRTYLNQLHLQNYARESRNGDEQTEQIRNDLRLLYTEIEDVTAILVENEYATRLQLAEADLQKLAGENAKQCTLQVTSGIGAITDVTTRLSTRYRHLQAHRALCNVIQHTFMQDSIHPDASSIHSENEGLPSVHRELQILLRHLALFDNETAGHSDVARKLQLRSTTLKKEVENIVKSATDEIGKLATEDRQRLAHTLTLSNNKLSQVVQQVKILDEHMSVVKTRLEESHVSLDKGDDFRQRFIGRFRRA